MNEQPHRAYFERLERQQTCVDLVKKNITPEHTAEEIVRIAFDVLQTDSIFGPVVSDSMQSAGVQLLYEVSRDAAAPRRIPQQLAQRIIEERCEIPAREAVLRACRLRAESVLRDPNGRVNGEHR